jgi:hypothetical protein
MKLLVLREKSSQSLDSFKTLRGWENRQVCLMQCKGEVM